MLGSDRRRRKEEAERLGSLAVLRHCDRRELAAVADAVVRHELEAGHVLYRAGAPADGAAIVEHGRLDVVRDGAVVATLGSGEVVGELGPLGAKARNADVVARTGATVLELSSADLRRLLADCGGLRRGLTPVLAERAQEG